MKHVIQRSLLCVILLMACTMVQAASINFAGNAVSNCSLSGKTYTCSSFPLANWNDDVVIADTYAVVMSGSYTFDYNTGLTMNGSASLSANGDLNIGSINPSTLSISSGTLRAGGTFTMGTQPQTIAANVTAPTIVLNAPSRFTGTLTASSSVTVASGSTVNGAISAPIVTLDPSNVQVTGTISAPTSLTVGSGNTITGNVSAGSVVLKASNSIIRGNLSATGSVMMESGTTVTGSLSSTSGTVNMLSSNARIGGTLNAVTLEVEYGFIIDGNVVVTTARAPQLNSGTFNGTVTCTYGYNVVCAPPTPSGPNHYELSMPTSGVNCLPLTVTVKACSNSSSPCTSLYTAATGSITLTASTGTIGTATFGAGTGTATTTFSYPTAAEGATATVSLPSSATNTCCPAGGSCSTSNSCSATFNKTGFIFSAAQGGAAVNIGTQVAGTSSLSYYLRAVKSTTTNQACEAALTGTQAVNLAYKCNNPTACFSTDLMSVNGVASATIKGNANASNSINYTSVNLSFDANGNAPFTLNYGDVGQVTLYASKTVANSAVLTGTSNAFVVKPGGFTLSGIKRTANPGLAVNTATTATGEVFLKAGDPFTARVTVTTSGGATTPNFGKETTPEDVNLAASAAIDPATGTAFVDMTQVPNPAGTFLGSTFNNGVADLTNLSWDSVGIVMLTPKVADGDYLGTGSVTGTAAKVGRFVPHHFTVTSPSIVNRTATAACAASTFSYMGEPLKAHFTLEARNTANTIALNYTGKFVKLDPTTAIGIPPTDGPLHAGAVNTAATRTPFPVCGATPSHPCFTPATASGSFTSGAATIDLPLTVFRGPVAAGPYPSFSVGIAPVDSDGIAMGAMNLDTVNASDRARVGTTVIRYGRMKVDNTYGSEQLALPVKLQAQYWDGANFVTNTSDSCSPLVAGNFSLTAASGAAIATTLPANAAMVNGVSRNFTLSKPSPTPAGKGSVLLRVLAPLADYLPGNGTQTFGVYKSGPVIYIREVY